MIQDFGKDEISSCVQKLAYTLQKKMKYPMRSQQIVDLNKSNWKDR